jgi:aminoglycoside phosphotransferase (APT) family kinase protein
VSFPPAQGERLPWERVPAAIRETIEQRLGAPVARATTRPGGFSPGLAARLELEDRRAVFAKAVGPEPNPDSPHYHRSEARIAAALPPETPAPRLLFSVEDDAGWVALVFEHVDGREPRLPWQPDELQRVLHALTELSRALTPSPLGAPPIGEHFDELFDGWRRLAAEPDPAVDPWSREHLEELAALEARWAEAAAGETLLHADVRADNIVLAQDRVVFVDWPHACVGAGWVDLLALLPSVAMQGGPHPWEIWESHPLGRDVPAQRLQPMLAALAGYFAQRATQPPPPGLPTVREFQRAQGVEALAWLRRSLGES